MSRPKVYSIAETSLNGLSIAVKQDILWPCHAFSISIPVKDNLDELNIFEKTVLKLSEIYGNDTGKISDLMCVSDAEDNHELVSFIRNRLQQLELLDDKFEISAQGLDILEEIEDTDDYQYVSATVFLDLLSGKLLPYIAINNIENNIERKKIVEVNKDFVSFYIQPTDSHEKTVRARKLPFNGGLQGKKLGAHDIVKTIKAYKQKYKNYSSTKHDDTPYQFIPSKTAISIDNNPELVFLHCQLLMQTGNDELLVTDGYGFGFCDFFSDYLISRPLNNDKWHWLQQFKKKAIFDSGFTQKTEHTPYKPHQYPNILKKMVVAKKGLKTIVKKDNNKNSFAEKDIVEQNKKISMALYDVLEHVFKELFLKYSNTLDIFDISDEENAKILTVFLLNMGFEINDPKQIKKLLWVKHGKVRSVVEQGKVEMQPLLALAVTEANFSMHHPLHRLAKEHPQFFYFINELKVLRDHGYHGGDSKKTVPNIDILKSYYNTVLLTITLLIPDFDDKTLQLADKQNIKGVRSFDNVIDQQRLKASIKFEEKIGVNSSRICSSHVRDEMINYLMLSSELETNTTDELLLQSSINKLSIIIEQFLITKIEELPANIDKHEEDFREQALDKIITFGFYNEKSDICDALQHVNTERIERSLQKTPNASLGAHLLAFILLHDDTYLNNLRNKIPEFIKTISQLMTLRGHGNTDNIHIDLSFSVIKELETQIFLIIKTLNGDIL